MPDDWDLPEGQTQYSEVDELRARLAEVTAERDAYVSGWAQREKEAAEANADLAQLLDAVEAYRQASGYTVYVGEANQRMYELVALAANIRKKRS